jgi:hypothetical protein
MKSGCVAVCLLFLLTACGSGWDITTPAIKKTSHFRTLASLTPASGADKGVYSFEIRKRNKAIMAEKVLYQNGDFSASLIGGRHKKYRWMTGLGLNYNF